METRFELTSSLRVVDSAHGSVSTKKSQGFMTRSSYSAVLILSVGVTARTLSTAPAVIPASIPRPGERTPRSSARELRIVSYDTNRTAAFAVVPYIFDQYEVRIDEIAILTTIRVVHPVYKAPTPSCFATWKMRRNGLEVLTALLSSN